MKKRNQARFQRPNGRLRTNRLRLKREPAWKRRFRQKQAKVRREVAVLKRMKLRRLGAPSEETAKALVEVVSDMIRESLESVRRLIDDHDVKLRQHEEQFEEVSRRLLAVKADAKWMEEVDQMKDVRRVLSGHLLDHAKMRVADATDKQLADFLALQSRPAPSPMPECVVCKKKFEYGEIQVEANSGGGRRHSGCVS